MIVLRHRLEYSPAEIASLLGLPRGMVNSRPLRRGSCRRTARSGCSAPTATSPGRRTASSLPPSGGRVCSPSIRTATFAGHCHTHRRSSPLLFGRRGRAGLVPERLLALLAFADTEAGIHFADADSGRTLGGFALTHRATLVWTHDGRYLFPSARRARSPWSATAAAASARITAPPAS